MHSFLQARLGVGARQTQTRLLELNAGAPLKIARPFPLDDGGLELCLMDCSPGILSGDQYVLDFSLQTGAAARVTTQGFTRVHPARNLETSSLHTKIHLEQGAALEWIPGPTLPFKNARLNSQTQAFVSSGARLFLLESWGAGRIARGEKWEFDSFCSLVELRDEDGPLAFNRFFWQKKAPFNPFSPTAFGEWTHFASLFCIGDWPAVAPETLANVSRETTSAECEVTASTLSRRGHLFLLRSTRAQSLQEAAHAVLAWHRMAFA